MALFKDHMRVLLLFYRNLAITSPGWHQQIEPPMSLSNPSFWCSIAGKTRCVVPIHGESPATHDHEHSQCPHRSLPQNAPLFRSSRGKVAKGQILGCPTYPCKPTKLGFDGSSSFVRNTAQTAAFSCNASGLMDTLMRCASGHV